MAELFNLTYDVGPGAHPRVIARLIGDYAVLTDAAAHKYRLPVEVERVWDSGLRFDADLIGTFCVHNRAGQSVSKLSWIAPGQRMMGAVVVTPKVSSHGPTDGATRVPSGTPSGAMPHPLRIEGQLGRFAARQDAA
jgi:hypothetical protein